MCCCIFSPLGNTSPQPTNVKITAKTEYLFNYLVLNAPRDPVRGAPLKALAMLMPYGEIRENPRVGKYQQKCYSFSLVTQFNHATAGGIVNLNFSPVSLKHSTSPNSPSPIPPPLILPSRLVVLCHFDKYCLANKTHGSVPQKEADRVK